jgi:riboflavin kinase/FMN adenylyltransferase
MEQIVDIGRLRRKRRPIVLAAGFFDGIHLGHRKVLGRTLARARELNGRAWVLTFESHPLSVLRPATAPRLLLSNRYKLLLLERLGLDGCVLLDFTRAVADIAPAEFVQNLRAAAPALAEIVVGRDWRFGRKGAGNPALLRRMGRELGFGVTAVGPVRRGGLPVSSTRTRAAILDGDLAAAATLLGRPFSILETVIPGRTMGRKLGYPTANLAPRNEILPPHGVYAVFAHVRGTLHRGVLNFGRRPTFAGRGAGDPVIELHLLDARPGELYGDDVEVFFVSRIRSERRFKSEAALRSRIAADVESATALLSPKNLEECLYRESGGVL